jgi:hypothetical protein
VLSPGLVRQMAAGAAARRPLWQLRAQMAHFVAHFISYLQARPSPPMTALSAPGCRRMMAFLQLLQMRSCMPLAALPVIMQKGTSTISRPPLVVSKDAACAAVHLRQACTSVFRRGWCYKLRYLTTNQRRSKQPYGSQAAVLSAASSMRPASMHLNRGAASPAHDHAWV